VELLVTCAVIALLAAILLPTLARAKSSAARVRCVSNLHQLGLAGQMYWDDNAGNCFRYGGTFTNNGQHYWFGWIGQGPEGQRAFDPTPGALYPYLQGRGVEKCPSLMQCLAEFKAKATEATYGYGYNLYLSAPLTRPPTKVSAVKRPGGTAFLADAAQVNTWQAPASAANPMLEEWYYIDNSTNQPNGHFRHARRANVVFCDGHVGLERFVRGSLDTRLPNQYVARFSPEILLLNP
jgi:prepilin-type processing-associated H-X9-DG protein